MTTLDPATDCALASSYFLHIFTVDRRSLVDFLLRFQELDGGTVLVHEPAGSSQRDHVAWNMAFVRKDPIAIAADDFVVSQAFYSRQARSLRALCCRR